MKTKATKQKEVVKLSDVKLLSLVAAKVKDRELFPKMVESARKYLQKVKFPTS